MIIYDKNGNILYQCTDPSEIKAICESIANNLSQNYYTSSQVMSLIASSRAVYQVATLPANPSRNTIYYVGSTAPYNVKLIDSNGTVVDLGSSSVDLTDYIKYSDITTTINNNSTNLQVPGAKAVYDGFAPRSSTFICGTYQQLFRNVNDAVFDFDTTGDEIRQVGRKQFCVSNVVNPITNGSVFGFCETEILVNNHTGIGPKIYIYQTVKAMQDNTMIFKRKGMLTGPFDCTKIYENRASISWGNWCPIDYPSFEIARNTTNTTSGVICAIITGGTLKIELEALKLASAPGGNSVIIATIPTGLNTALKSWPGYSTYYRGSAFNINATTPHFGLIQVYKNDGKIYVFGNFVANENIWGSITAELGY